MVNNFQTSLPLMDFGNLLHEYTDCTNPLVHFDLRNLLRNISGKFQEKNVA